MPDEKANNRFHWKDKLGGLDRLPGEAPVDKDAGWQQLQDRLQERPRDRKRSGYWIAAACLLGVMIMTRLVLMQPGGTLVKREPHPIPQTFSKPLPVTNNQETVVSTQQPAKKKSSFSLESKNKVHPAVVKAVSTVGPVLLPDTIKETLPEAAIYQSIDTVHLVAAAPKKKLRVVHINELNRPGEDTQLASNAQEPSSGKLMRENDLSHFSISRNASDNIVKIKLSSSN